MSDEDVVWFVSSEIAVRWEETTAFLWWFKVRQLAKCYRDCDPRSARWADNFRSIQQHVPFHPSLDLICLDTPASMVEFIQASRMLRCLKRRAHIAIPLPPLRARPLVQQYFLEHEHSHQNILEYPPLRRTRATSPSRIRAWASLAFGALNSIAASVLTLRIWKFSEEDLRLGGEGSFFRTWVVCTLEEAACMVDTLSIQFNTLTLPGSESLVWVLFIRMLQSRTSTRRVWLTFRSTAWSTCELHRKMYTRMRRAIMRVPHPFEIDVTYTHYGGRERNDRHFAFPAVSA